MSGEINEKDGMLFHLGFDINTYNAEYAVIPGAPERCEKIAAYFINPVKIAQNREFTTYLAKTNSGKNVFITSTGIGGPSAAIAVEELHKAGVKTFIRTGTAGGIDTSVCGGDLVIAMSAVRQEGTSLHYAPPEYPATADFDVVCALKTVAENTDNKYHIGVVQSKDSFYGQHSPESSPVADELKYKWTAWKKLHVLCSEMESSTVFTVAKSLGCRAGAVFHIIWNQERKAENLDDNAVYDTDKAVKCAVDAINILSE